VEFLKSLRNWLTERTKSEIVFMLFALFGIGGSIVGVSTASNSGQSASHQNTSTTTIVTTTTAKVTTTTAVVRLAENGHLMRLCATPLKNNTDYSYCYWNGPEKAPGNQLDFNNFQTFNKTPIVGSNFTYVNLSYGFETTDPSGMYSVNENSAVTIRPLHNCILVNTTFAVDVQEMQALNSQPLDAMDFTNSTIGGNTLKGMAGRGVNFSHASLSGADLAGSDFTNVRGIPASLPPSWIVDANKDIVLTP
jgi:uncharacterized protein YjbI with pentapeptide repeats